jgi:hypothetical protein
MNEMREIQASDLANVEGGCYWHSDGFCGTPYPWPPRPCVQNWERFECGYDREYFGRCVPFYGR